MRTRLLSILLLTALGIPLVVVANVASPSAGSLARQQATTAASQIDGARTRWEISCNIRKDKFDFVLPKAMRANNIDMWIVIDRGRGTQPMTLDFAISTVNGQGFFVFINHGAARIERDITGGRIDHGREAKPI